MNSLKNIKEYEAEINRCSRCGLCSGVCPIFEITKNDCTSPRGKCIILKEILTREQPPSKLVKKYMSMCTNCGKCFDFCPVKIDITKINEKLFKKSFLFDLIKKILEKLLRKNKTLKLENGSKIAYVKPYADKIIPEEIKKYNYTVYENLNCNLDFCLKYPKLSEAVSKKLIEQIVKEDFECICTTDIVSYIELKKQEKRFYLTGKIVYVNEISKKR